MSESRDFIQDSPDERLMAFLPLVCHSSSLGNTLNKKEVVK